VYVVTVDFTHTSCPRHYMGKIRSKCSGKCYEGTFGPFDQFDAALEWAISVRNKEHARRPGIVITGAELHLTEKVEALWHV
jgi:hypothetical protein